MAMAAKGAGDPVRILMFPWLAHGHVFPFLELSKKLCKRGFQISFCSTPINLDDVRRNLDKDSSYSYSIELVELNLPSLPELPPEFHTNKNVPPRLVPLLLQAFQMSSAAFSDVVARVAPDLLIYDGFQPWAAKAAAEAGIPAVFFSTANSTSLAFFHHMYTHKDCDSFPHEAIRLRDYEKRDLIAQSAYMEVHDQSEGFAFGVLKLSSDVVLIKSVRGIEGKYADYLSSLCERKVVFTGVLVPVPEEENQESTADEILKWLSERKKQRSTLYISFGSENYLSPEMTAEVARGLEELVDVSFVWVARPPPGEEAAAPMPEGFEERTRERGLVVRDWAPQTAILAHPSVGAFMSHCGWSSMTESVSYGVPLVGLPLKFDQSVNARLAVEAGVGVEVARGEAGEIDAAAVARAVEEVMGEGGEGYRRRAEEWREKMQAEEEGAIDEVAKELSRISASSNK